jgi:hypothetical protein
MTSKVRNGKEMAREEGERQMEQDSREGKEMVGEAKRQWREA